MSGADSKTLPVQRVSGFSEDEYGRKIDACLTDTLIKSGGGLLIGTVFSLLFFKRRKWPLILGTGFGFGTAYSNCERDLNGSSSL